MSVRLPIAVAQAAEGSTRAVPASNARLPNPRDGYRRNLIDDDQTDGVAPREIEKYLRRLISLHWRSAMKARRWALNHQAEGACR